MTQSEIQTVGNDIVVGVDGSDESFAALKFALQEAAITGQKVNAVFGWTHSWDMGAEPDNDEAWKKMRQEISGALRDWVERATDDIEFDPENLELTSVKATGTSALLQIGADAQQIVVGRRSLGRVARWFMGSLSASLAEESKSPVTVVRIVDDDADTVQDSIANALTPTDQHVHFKQPQQYVNLERRPVVVGVDASETSRHALAFAGRFMSCSAGSSRISAPYRVTRTPSRRSRPGSDAPRRSWPPKSPKRSFPTHWTWCPTPSIFRPPRD